MRLAEFIRTRPDAIEREWEEFAGTLTPFAAGLSVSTLRDHLREILEAIADDMASAQSSEQQREKSRGKGPRGGALDRVAAVHAGMRLNSGFDLEHAIAEYRALRASILRLWSQSGPVIQGPDLDEVSRFNESIDQTIAEMVRRFASNATRYSDRFVGILVHDLRSPLNLIGVAAHQLLNDRSPNKIQLNATRILKGVWRIDRLVTDLAVLVRSRVGSPLPLTKVNADLGTICEQAVEEVRASHGEIAFEVLKGGNLSGYWDRERLARVVSNLSVNAIVHASAKNVELTVQDAGPEVVLKVTNYGKPIPAEMLDSIFEPLVHEGRAASHELSSGLGLGLFIVREIVRAHGGQVQVSSSELEGTIFTVRLPRRQPDLPA